MYLTNGWMTFERSNALSLRRSNTCGKLHDAILRGDKVRSG